MYKPNGSAEDIKLNILHSVGGYYVSNEGSKSKPNYHVWVPGITCASCDSAYHDISLAVARCNYLAKQHLAKLEAKYNAATDRSVYKLGNKIRSMKQQLGL